MPRVAPHAGARIETITLTVTSFQPRWSHLMRVRGLKHFSTRQRANDFLTNLIRVRGLKHQ
jgi:hypothetical protein